MLNRLIKAAGTMLLIILIMTGVTGCMNEEQYSQLIEDMKKVVDDNTESSVLNAKKLLSQKYGIEFEAVQIGNRLNKDTSDLLMYPADNPDLYFIATVNNNTMECNDNLVKRAVAQKISAQLYDNLKDEGMDTCSAIRILSDDDKNESNIDISPEEFFELYNVDGLMIYLIISANDSEFSENTIRNSCKKIKEKYGVNVAVNSYLIKDNFMQCREAMIKNPDISSTWFEKYHPVSESVFSVNQNDRKAVERMSELWLILIRK